MPTLIEIRSRYEQRHANVFAKARDTERRLTDAAALNTIHAARLHKLARYTRYAIGEFQADDMECFLDLWELAFTTTIGDAMRAAGQARAAA